MDICSEPKIIQLICLLFVTIGGLLLLMRISRTMKDNRAGQIVLPLVVIVGGCGLFVFGYLFLGLMCSD